MVPPPRRLGTTGVWVPEQEAGERRSQREGAPACVSGIAGAGAGEEAGLCVPPRPPGVTQPRQRQELHKTRTLVPPDSGVHGGN